MTAWRILYERNIRDDKRKYIYSTAAEILPISPGIFQGHNKGCRSAVIIKQYKTFKRSLIYGVYSIFVLLYNNLLFYVDFSHIWPQTKQLIYLFISFWGFLVFDYPFFSLFCNSIISMIKNVLFFCLYLCCQI